MCGFGKNLKKQKSVTCLSSSCKERSNETVWVPSGGETFYSSVLVEGEL